MLGNGALQESGIERGEHRGPGSHRRIDLGGYPGKAGAVGALDHGEALSVAHFGHGCEGHLTAVCRSDAQIVERVQGAAFPLGVAHHEANVILAALDSLHFLPIERLPHLGPQIRQRDAQCLAGWGDRQDHLRLAAGQRVGNSVNPRKLSELPADCCGDAAHGVRFGAAYAYVDFRRGFEPVGDEGHLDGIRYGVDSGAPQGGHFVRRYGPQLAGGELHGDLAEVGAGSVGPKAQACGGGELPAPGLHDV